METIRKFLEKNGIIIVSVVIVCVIILGAIYSILLGNTLRYWDETEYYSAAMNLSKGIFSINGTAPTAFTAPGYPFILYVLSWINPEIVFLRYCNFIFLGLSIALIYLLMKKIVSIPAGVISAIISAFYPLFFYTAGTLYSQTADSFLLIAALYVIYIDKPASQVLLGFLSGLIFGSSSCPLLHFSF